MPDNDKKSPREIRNDKLLDRTPYQKKGSGIGYITFAAHLRAFALYSFWYGNSQSPERIAERWGFGEEELDIFYPEWRNHIIN